jgi:Na+/H+ antiporter NhaD/arsenite permease-like protein
MVPIAVMALVVEIAVVWLVHRHALGGTFAAAVEERQPKVYCRWVRKSGLVMVAVLVAFVAGSPSPWRRRSRATSRSLVSSRP